MFCLFFNKIAGKKKSSTLVGAFTDITRVGNSEPDTCIKNVHKKCPEVFALWVYQKLLLGGMWPVGRHLKIPALVIVRLFLQFANVQSLQPSV